MLNLLINAELQKNAEFIMQNAELRSDAVRITL